MELRVSSYIESLEEGQQVLAAQLREIIWEQVPAVVEKFSYKVPFYHYFGMFCYINAIKDGIELGLCRGKDLIVAYPQLEMGNRVMVAGVRLYAPGDVARFDIKALIAGAAAWQEECWGNRQRFNKGRPRRQ